MDMAVLMIEFDFKCSEFKQTPFKCNESYLKKGECVRLKLKRLHIWSDPFY